MTCGYTICGEKMCDAILSAFLMVGVILLWYFFNYFSFIKVVLLGSVNCSNVVMFSSSSCRKYFLFRFGVIVGKLFAFCSHSVASGVSVCRNVVFLFECGLGHYALEEIVFLKLGNVSKLLYLVMVGVGPHHI